uniref:Putative nonfluorescent protein n=1 Tax=Charistephane fugiens TaxID=140462 RepID=A0A1C8YXK7_9METZ|nr:putative nonfluorescent protein [Charistephane fugiens]
MDSRMERAESVFAGTTKSKLIADLTFGDNTYKLSGEGFANPHDGQHTLEMHCYGTEPVPVNWCIIAPILQYPFRVFTQYTGTGMYDFFKTSFPGGLVTEMVATFKCGGIISGTHNISYVKDTVVCRAQLVCENFSTESVALSHGLGPVLPCYELIDGVGVDEVSSTMDLEWKDNNAVSYKCRLESEISSNGAANFSPLRHWVAHDSKVVDATPNRLHFSQRDKARANVINFYKN